MYKYAFIGGGPSTLSAIASLSEVDRLSSVVVEAGKDDGRRICPQLKPKDCTSCYDEKCHVLNGLGGASATFGNKFCHFPASEGLFAGKAAVGSKVRSAAQVTHAKAANDGTVVQHPKVPNRKVYDVEVSNLDDYREHMAELIEEVRSTTEILVETEVEQIEQLDMGGFRLHLSSGSTIDAEQVVVATGRSGHKALRKWLTSLEVEYSENSPDIGFRVELPTRAISKHFFYQDDPKYKFTFGSLGSARTFCTCKGGAIIPVKFGGGVYADGAFLRKDTGLTNLAMMARTDDTFDAEALEEWCERENLHSDGRLERASFDVSKLTVDEVKQKVVASAPSGPNSSYAIILEKLVDQLLDRDKVDFLAPSLQEPTLMSIYGPSIDNYWPKVQLTNTFETSRSGLYVIGDAAGYSRGIYQAMFAGQEWAQAQQVEQNVGIAK